MARESVAEDKGRYEDEDERAGELSRSMKGTLGEDVVGSSSNDGGREVGPTGGSACCPDPSLFHFPNSFCLIPSVLPELSSGG